MGLRTKLPAATLWGADGLASAVSASAEHEEPGSHIIHKPRPCHSYGDGEGIAEKTLAPGLRDWCKWLAPPNAALVSAVPDRAAITQKEAGLHPA